jgi:hypothetical protein|tara:strand:+ start:552 stop:953 length:402 start_codon:yes stop_codon:yes gene_type:complete
MEKYKQLLNMVMDFNESVRFAAVSDSHGQLLWNSQRNGVSNIVPIEKTKSTMSRSRSEWDNYASASEHVGNGLYSITSYSKIKRITIPLSDGKMLFISVNNKPMKNAKNTSYGHLVEMGEILSIVEFVESQNF